MWLCPKGNGQLLQRFRRGEASIRSVLKVHSSCVETDWRRNVLRDYGKTGETGRGVKYWSRRNLGVACTAERTV